MASVSSRTSLASSKTDVANYATMENGLIAHPHIEHHKAPSEFLRDAIIGFADGLTVPFALTAGLSA